MSGFRLAVIGYGQLGSTLAQLAVRAGMSVRAFDPLAEVPLPMRADTADDAIADATHVVLAVPGEGLEPVLRRLTLRGQLVLEVGSVKTRPIAVMQATLGSANPWVGTHPLFGPRSVSEPGAALRVVVCPNPLHPEAAAKARALYQRLGCEVIELDAAEHDRRMAQTHAVMFFLARGLLGSTLAQTEGVSTASFEALRKLVMRVAAEPEHVVESVLGGNPEVPAMRARLLGALESIDAQYAADDGASGALAADELLASARQRIDALDRRLLVVLQQRTRLMSQVARAKRDLGIGVRDPAREAAVLESRKAWAVELGLAPQMVDDLFETVFAHARALQEREGTP